MPAGGANAPSGLPASESDLTTSGTSVRTPTPRQHAAQLKLLQANDKRKNKKNDVPTRQAASRNAKRWCVSATCVGYLSLPSGVDARINASNCSPLSVSIAPLHLFNVQMCEWHAACKRAIAKVRCWRHLWSARLRGSSDTTSSVSSSEAEARFFSLSLPLIATQKKKRI